MNMHFAEKNQVVMLIQPIDLAAGANTGDWVCMKGYGRCAIILIKEPGTAGSDPTLTFLQASSVAGSNSKALNVTDIRKKQAATDLTAVGTYTKSTSASPASNDTFSTNTWTNSDLAEQSAIVIADFKAEDLDIANGFDCLSLTIADVGTTGEIGCVIAVLHEPRNLKETLDSAIIN